MFFLTFSLTKRLRIAVFLLPSLMLNACQHTPTIVSEKPLSEAVVDDISKAHALKLEAIKTFKLESKIAIQHAGKGHSGRLLWQHVATSDQLQLLSPFGQQVAVITRTPQQARLVDQQQRTHTAMDVETLTQQLLGWSLPLTGLPYWVIGLPVPQQSAQTEYNPTGYLQELVQDGWHIRYDDYRPATEINADNQMTSSVVLPHSIDLQRLATESQGTESSLKIRLKVISWQVD